jgi:hypothetical protein
MKGIKIVLTVFMSIMLLFVVKTGFAQKADKKEPIPQNPIQQVSKLVTIIRDCYVPYIDTMKLFAVVETSVVPSEIKVKETETGKNRGIGKGKSTANEKNQTVEQTYEYAISPEVEIREQTEKGLQFNIETIASVGYITKADIFVMKNEVIKIIILDMEQ